PSGRRSRRADPPFTRGGGVGARPAARGSNAARSGLPSLQGPGSLRAGLSIGRPRSARRLSPAAVAEGVLSEPALAVDPLHRSGRPDSGGPAVAVLAPAGHPHGRRRLRQNTPGAGGGEPDGG